MSLRRRDRGIEAEAAEVKLGFISQEGGYLGPSHCPVSQGWFS